MDTVCTRTIARLFGTCLIVCAVILASTSIRAQQAPAASAQAKAVGEIKSIGGGALMLATDDGKTVSVSLPDGVRVVRIPPGATDLKSATPSRVQDLQVGRPGAGQGSGVERCQDR